MCENVTTFCFLFLIFLIYLFIYLFIFFGKSKFIYEISIHLNNSS